MAPVLAGLILLSATACGRSATNSSSGRVKVIASFYPLAEAATRVGGDRVDVRNLTPPGVEPHDLELNTGEVAAIQDAALVLVMGRGFQPAVEKAAAGRSGTAEVLTRLPVTDTATENDPHVWLDPVLMSSIVDQVVDAMARADTGSADGYHSRGAAFKKELSDLDSRYRDGLSSCARREIVTSHEAFGWLARRYGLTQEGVLGLSPEQEPDPGRLAALVDFVKQHGVTVVFTESLVSPKVAETLAREAGVRTEVLDPLEGLSDDQVRGGDNYVSVMDENLRKLREALGCR